MLCVLDRRFALGEGVTQQCWYDGTANDSSQSDLEWAVLVVCGCT
jgi:hypothetical protein